MDAIVNMMDMIGMDKGGMMHMICMNETKVVEPWRDKKGNSSLDSGFNLYISTTFMPISSF